MNKDFDTKYITAILFALALVIAVFMFNSRVLNKISDNNLKTGSEQEEASQANSGAESSNFIPDGDLSDNYMSNAVNASGEYAIWANMPVRVYIPETNRYHDTVKSAFNKYNRTFNGLIEFTFTDDKSDAQINVAFPQRLENGEHSKQLISGLTNNFTSGKYIQSTNMQILTGKNGKDFSQEMIYNTTLHEIGHALGINGHSQNNNDVMYAESFQKGWNDLSKRDIATLKIMYSKNENLISQNTAGAASEKLKEAISYTQQVPNKTAGWINLGNVYYDLKMLPEALDAYKKALQIDPSDPNIYASMGTCYYTSQKYETAAEFFGYAMERTRNSLEYENYEYMRALSNLSAKKYNEAYLQYDALVKRYPNKKDYIINYLYLCVQLNKPEGKETLQNFLQSNPDAANDSKIQQYRAYYKL